ncbi:MAG: 16S rRNA (guanine(966)-N(2))-methyltransferase RsmD [Acidobacteriota bacterium]|nr:16S rRNA (guanine(966)-N(2))-methyltransferase RsmD [Acidobacteriota bacterium]MDQ7087942.1 16S rRNA (guanine(966)-N(2))-methyltransferase RsmD [Acidobacteriota bacterium]
MRIIGGSLRGRRLGAVPKRGVRPTADPVREALFNILGPDVVGHFFIDLCAGTGAVGFEALSRGARPVVLVEKSRVALRAIDSNIERLALGDAAHLRVVRADVQAWLAQAGPLEGPGVVYVDPPYGERRTGRWVDALVGTGGLLPAGALAVVEHRSGHPPLVTAGRPSWTRRYGDTSLSAWAASRETGAESR